MYVGFESLLLLWVDSTLLHSNLPKVTSEAWLQSTMSLPVPCSYKTPASHAGFGRSSKLSFSCERIASGVELTYICTIHTYVYTDYNTYLYKYATRLAPTPENEKRKKKKTVSLINQSIRTEKKIWPTRKEKKCQHCMSLKVWRTF